MQVQQGIDSSKQQRAIDFVFLKQIEHNLLYAYSKPAKETIL
jgi:hypothetical protein